MMNEIDKIREQDREYKEKPVPFTVCFAVNDNYAPHAAALLVSIMTNKLPDEEIVFYCFADNLPEETKQKFRQMCRERNTVLHFIDVDMRPFEKMPAFYGQKTPYVRLSMGRFLPESVEKILYLDSDMIVTASLSELFATDITGKYAAVAEGEIFIPHLQHLHLHSPYFGSGMMLLNLTLYRQNRMEEKAFAFAEKEYKTLLFPDQDILNVIFGGNVVYVPLKWNCAQHHRLSWFPYFNRTILYLIGRRFAEGYFARLRTAEQYPCIIHYSNTKPWDGGCNAPRHLKKEYWKYAAQTPFYDRLCFPQRIVWRRLWRNILNIFLLGGYPILHYLVMIRKK